MASATPAEAISERMASGIALTSLGGAGALVSDFGCLVHLSRLESAGGWGWLSLASGITTVAGGVTLAATEQSVARRIGAGAIAYGVFSAVLGIASIALPAADSPWKTPPAAIAPLLAPGVAGLTLGGVF